MILLNFFIFLCFLSLLLWAGPLLIKALMGMAKFLGWREFIIAFFVIAFASAAPNFFLGISAALYGIPELSFADVVGGNFVDLTLAIALAVLVAKKLPTDSRLVQASCLFTALIALLPLFLILDGTLSRGDGAVLIFVFCFYVIWLFSKKERYIKLYDDNDSFSLVKSFKIFLQDFLKLILGIILLSVGAVGVVRTVSFLAQAMNLPLSLFGILVIGLGNALPEIYFAIVSARRGETWMILGNLMGSIVVPATLVLGAVALVRPINIPDFSPFVLISIFLVGAAFLFFFFIRTGREITKKEAIFLLLFYILFVVLQVLLG